MACLGFSPSWGTQGHHRPKTSNAFSQECTCRCSIPNSNGVELNGVRLPKNASHQLHPKMGCWPLTTTTTTTKSSRLMTRNCWGAGGNLKKERKKKKAPVAEAGEEEQHTHYVNWFREAWPYIQGHRGSTFVLVIPGEVVGNRAMIDCILQVMCAIFSVNLKVLNPKPSLNPKKNAGIIS
jgi:hypothetical protein